jgi:hypothetical protein
MATTTRYQPLYAPDAACIAGSMPAAQAGIHVLQEGGTAADASIAAMGRQLAVTDDARPWVATALMVSTGFGKRLLSAVIRTTDEAEVGDVLGVFARDHGTRSFYDLVGADEHDHRPGAVDSRSVPWDEPMHGKLANATIWCLDHSLLTMVTGARSHARPVNSPEGVDTVPSRLANLPFCLTLDHRGTSAGIAMGSSVQHASGRMVAIRTPDLWCLAISQGHSRESAVIATAIAAIDGRERVGSRLQAMLEASPAEHSLTSLIAADLIGGLAIACYPPGAGISAAVY